MSVSASIRRESACARMCSRSANAIRIKAVLPMAGIIHPFIGLSSRILRLLRKRGGRMEFCNLGRTGLKVSELCMGTMTFGWTATEEQAFEILDTYVESGGNFLDTANVYTHGVSEEIIGRWLTAGATATISSSPPRCVGGMVNGQ